MALLVLMLFIALPIAELWVIIQVGGSIGVGPTLALLVLDSLLGAVLLRSQGRLTWARFNLALGEGRVPAGEVFDGAVVILGGALLLTPGFITDVFGLLMLIPATRGLVRRGSAALARRRISFGWTVMGTGPAGAGTGEGERRASPRAYDYEGTATEVPEDPRELPGSGDDRG
ncbi:MAG: FxsA family protein [bacterium]